MCVVEWREIISLFPCPVNSSFFLSFSLFLSTSVISSSLPLLLSVSQWACQPVRMNQSTQTTPPGETWRGRPAVPDWRKYLTLSDTHLVPSPHPLALSVTFGQSCGWAPSHRSCISTSVLAMVQTAWPASVLHWSHKARHLSHQDLRGLDEFMHWHWLEERVVRAGCHHTPNWSNFRRT